MPALIGRDKELSLLLELLQRDAAEKPGIVFVTGEAGIGKSRLIDEALRRLARPVLRGEADAESRSPYAPLVEALRAFCRTDRDALATRPLARYLARLLPELGLEPVEADHPTLSAALCDAAATAGAAGVVLVLEDLHWADDATLDLLPDLSKVPAASGLTLVATYRNEELPRLHRLRRVRSELRRGRRLAEVAVGALDRDDIFALAEVVAGEPLPAAVLAAVHERSEGIPFYIEELVSVTISAAADTPGGSARESTVPETIRDAIRERTESFDPDVKQALEVMGAAGHSVPLLLLAELVDPDSVARLLEHGWLVEAVDDTAAFRHALVRDAVYADIPWLRRRELHRSLAETLEARAAPPEDIAHHWVAAREPERARPHLLAAARSFASVYAYRDAARLLREALTAWPEVQRDAERLAALELLAESLDGSGELDEAVTTWRMVATARDTVGDAEGLGRAQRRLATLLEIRGDMRAATDARIRAALAWERSAKPEEAAIERIAAASHLEGAGEMTAALDVVRAAANDAEASGERELVLRAQALEGEIRANLGEVGGVGMARAALDAALAEGYAAAATEAYFRLGIASSAAEQYEGAVDAYVAASDFCKRRGIEGVGEACLACLTPVLRHVGRWKEAVDVCRTLMRDRSAPATALNVAATELGLIQTLRGGTSSAPRLLAGAARFARTYDFFALFVESSWGVAMAASLEARDEEATAIATDLVRECLRREERHYSLSPLRWCSTWFSTRGDAEMVLSVVDALSTSAAATGFHEAKTALSHALVEAALVQGDRDLALSHARHALDLAQHSAAPYEVAEIRARCAVALEGAGERAAALDALTAAYRTAKKLGARPLARAIVDRFAELGEPVEPHLGRGAQAGVERGPLSRRELDVLRQVAAGRTNREIAEGLFISTRTVDMHVRNLLMKLDCRSRAEAVARAAELGLLGTASPADTA